MLDTSITVNILGKFLGKPNLQSNGENLSFIRDGRVISQIPITGIQSFFDVESGLFGGRFRFKYQDRTFKIGFLKSAEIDQFVGLLNEIVSANLQNHLSKIFNEFSSLVVVSYPRDSDSFQIENLILDLYARYQTQPLLWEQYLAGPYLQKVKELLAFYPFNLEEIRKFHERLQLKNRSAFYDNVESNPLTEEQRLGVIRSNDRNMVLAAAGTGKTSVMVAKALDLVERQLAEPSEILILAYNKAAAEELKERLVNIALKRKISLVSEPHISTFHALGRHLLREAAIPTAISVFAEDTTRLTQWVTHWIYEYVSEEPSRVFDLIELTTPPVDAFSFKTKADYESYIRDNEFRTLNNELVRGYQELQIANFLFINQVNYEYEAKYVTKRRLEVGFDYKPDFHISDTDIYIEHFGVDRQGKTRPDIDAGKYQQGMQDKRNLHRECETVLIETYHYEWKENTLLQNLKSRLQSAGVVFKPMHPSEIFEKLKNQEQLSSWSELMRKSLQSIRTERLDQPGIYSRLHTAKIYNPEKYSKLLDQLHDGYVTELKRQNSIDFDDMIIRAIQVVQSGLYSPRWKYILVDEFQDISAARMDFIQSLLSKGPKPSLTVVGDDWQSIYRFSGGKLELTTRFGEIMGSYSLTKLQKTFRYNNSIANTAGQFIMENPEQYKKSIQTHQIVNESQVYLLDDKLGKKGGVYERALEVVKKIRSHEPHASIAVIARYNYLLSDSKQLIWQEGFKDNIHFWSFHKSKGLEADYCVLIGFFQGKSGFPNENREDAVIEALLPSLDQYPHSEERRLLYVGITRAKKKCYIIANPSAPSDFITELLAPKYQLNIASDAFKERYRKIFKCPHCESGYFRLINGKFGNFYSCSSGLGCSVGKVRVCESCSAPSVDSRSYSTCNNSGCGEQLKICEKCGRPMKIRKGRFGEFWGCTGYGIKEDQCSHTQK